MSSNKKSIFIVLLEVFLRQRVFLDKFLTSTRYPRYCILFFLILASTIWTNSVMYYYSDRTFKFLFFLYIGGMFAMIGAYTIESLIILVITYIFMKKRLAFKKLLGGVIICNFPTLIGGIIHIFVPSIAINVSEGYFIDTFSLSYVFFKFTNSIIFLSIMNLIGFFEIWRIILTAFLLNILGEIRLPHGIIIVICTHLAFVLWRFLL